MTELTVEQKSERAEMALHGTWEIEALAKVALEKLPNELENFVTRAMLRRVIELNSAMMSALDNDTITAEELGAVIYA